MTGLRRTDRGLMRAMNTRLVLDAVRATTATSQADLIRTTRLSTGTIVSIMRELRELGMVSEIGQGASRGGRKPTLLKLNPAAAVVLSCRVGSTTATAAVLDVGANVLSRRELALAPAQGPAPFLAALAASFREQLQALRPNPYRVAGIGLSLHGPVDAERGIMLLSEHLGWRDVAFGDELGRALGLPVLAEAETRAIALAEQCWGAARGARDFVLIELDTGIGMVQVLDGKLCRGSHSLAGELGFTAWEIGPEQTPAPPRVLEQIASLRALCQQAGAEPVSGQGRAARRLSAVPPESICLRRLRAGAAPGDASARSLLDRTASALGLAVANVINLLDPELILLTGRMISETDGVLLAAIRDHVQAHLVGAQNRAPRIEPAVLGTDAALLGAARLVIDYFYSVESLARGRLAD